LLISTFTLKHLCSVLEGEEEKILLVEMILFVLHLFEICDDQKKKNGLNQEYFPQTGDV